LGSGPTHIGSLCLVILQRKTGGGSWSLTRRSSVGPRGRLLARVVVLRGEELERSKSNVFGEDEMKAGEKTARSGSSAKGGDDERREIK